MKQHIRFCRSFDGTRLAYALSGEGPPIVKAPHWLTHVEYEWRSPMWKPWIETLSREHTLLRMDERACGLSDWAVENISFEAWVRDVEATVDAAGFDRFAMLGHSQGGAIAVEYAVRHPERVTHLVLLGSYARGRLKRGSLTENEQELEAQLKLVELGWGRNDPAYRQMYSIQFMPSATLEQLRAMSDMQRVSASPANAVRIIRSFFTIDVCESASRVKCPTLVLHARGDVRVPFEEGRVLASVIPGARLVPLESENHILLEQDPAFHRFFAELRTFVPRGPVTVDAHERFRHLTAREQEILHCLAHAMDNAQIAAHLGLADKTVRNNITHIFDKLGVESRSQAIVLALNSGFGKE
jgi:pimeloyl-ACP methyl ester carboxylesterase/DNA-binding CsgD family transcriptional regulator